MERIVYHLYLLHLCLQQDFGLDDSKLYSSTPRLQNRNDNDNAASRDTL